MKGTLHFDGGGQNSVITAGCVIRWVDEFDDAHSTKLGRAWPWGTNNVAEWRALVVGMAEARMQGITDLTCYGDSQLIVNQAAGRWKVRDSALCELKDMARALGALFANVEYHWIPREENTEADEAGRQHA